LVKYYTAQQNKTQSLLLAIIHILEIKPSLLPDHDFGIVFPHTSFN